MIHAVTTDPGQESLFGALPESLDTSDQLRSPLLPLPAAADSAPVVVATDGSCLTNPGPGGWCWYSNGDCWAAGGEPETTNNRMELMAVFEVLRSLPTQRSILIKADSSYTIDACTKWIHGWKRRGWKTAQGSPVKNREIIEAIDAALVGRDVVFEWVKGHSGHSLNEAADERCRAAAEATKAGISVATGPGW